jgi:hypothetical protein
MVSTDTVSVILAPILFGQRTASLERLDCAETPLFSASSI